jgi:hypothetical protein
VPRPAERFAPGRPQPVRPAAGANGGTARPPQPGSRPSNDLDDYFDRLDAAFANMANTAEASAPQPPDTTARREGPVMERDLDWFDAPSTPAAPLHHPPPAEQHGSTPSGAVPGEAAPGPEFAATPAPVTFANPPNVPSWAAPQAPSIEPAETPASLAPAPGHPALVSQGAAGGGSAIADAFSALLAAEQGDADAPPFGFLAPQRPVATDELVEQVARRVLERLSDQSFRDLITDVVSRVAERVVREEIERIRSKYS